TAFERAREYAAIGIECLPGDAASRTLGLWRDLHVARLEAEHGMGDRRAARATFDVLRAGLSNAEDKVPAYVAWIRHETGTDPRAALDAGHEILRELGAPAPDPAGKLHVLAEYARARWAQGRRPASA